MRIQGGNTGWEYWEGPFSPVFQMFPFFHTSKRWSCTGQVPGLITTMFFPSNSARVFPRILIQDQRAAARLEVGLDFGVFCEYCQHTCDGSKAQESGLTCFYRISLKCDWNEDMCARNKDDAHVASAEFCSVRFSRMISFFFFFPGM